MPSFPLPRFGMSLSFQFARVGYVAELDELRYHDTTGAYDADLNPGGWGGPNTPRAAVALYALGELVRSDGRPGTYLLPPDHDDDPLTRVDFALRPGVDGLIRTAIVAIPAEDRAALDAKLADGLLTDDDVVYDRTGGALLVCRAQALVPATLLDVPYGRYQLGHADEALTPRAQVLRDQLFERVANLPYDGQADAYQNAADQHLVRLHRATKALVAAADICWQRGQASLFALRVERLTTLAAEASPLLA